MEDVALVAILIGLICILGGLVTATQAHRAYAAVLAGTYLCQTIALSVIMSMIMDVDITYWNFLIPAIIALIAYIMAKLVFLWLWGSLTLVGFVILGTLAMNVSNDPGDVITIATVGITFAVGLIGAIILRNHGKVITIGISSGYNVGIGIASILFAIISLKEAELLSLLMSVAVLGGVAVGIFYQYKVNRKLIDSLNAT